MRTTKLLPWIARKAGISDIRAEALWAESIRHATEQTGWVGTSEYWEAALAHWMTLIDDEGRLSKPGADTADSLAPSPLCVMVPPKSRDAAALGPKVA
jgi:hypothetical protein